MRITDQTQSVNNYEQSLSKQNGNSSVAKQKDNTPEALSTHSAAVYEPTSPGKPEMYEPISPGKPEVIKPPAPETRAPGNAPPRHNSSARSDMVTANRIQAQMELQAANTLYLIEQNFQRQAERSMLTGNTTNNIITDSQLQSEAAALVSEDGFWGVKQTSERIFDLAVALSGGDSNQMEVMRDAVTRGFDAAETQLGGELPDISQRTFNAVMLKFDNWGTQPN